MPYGKLDADGTHLVALLEFPPGEGLDGFTAMDDDDLKVVAYRAGTTLPQMAEALVAAAEKVCATITAQVVPTATQQSAYTNAAAMVGPTATVPTVEPLKTSFKNLATVYGFGSNLQEFATLVVAIASASIALTATLGAVKAAVFEAKDVEDLKAALTAFEAGAASVVAAVNGAGMPVTIAAPDPIIVPGLSD